MGNRDFFSVFEQFCVPTKNKPLLAILDQDRRVEKYRRNDSFCSNIARFAACQNPYPETKPDPNTESGQYMTRKPDNTTFRERSIFDACMTPQEGQGPQNDPRAADESVSQQPETPKRRSTSKERKQPRSNKIRGIKEPCRKDVVPVSPRGRTQVYLPSPNQ